MSVFQINFTQVGSAEMSTLPRSLQFEILKEFEALKPGFEEDTPEKFGTMEKDGRVLFRFRANNYRIYFEKKDAGILIHRILNKNTLKDFLYRSKVPLSEDEALQKNPNFWAMIDSSDQR